VGPVCTATSETLAVVDFRSPLPSSCPLPHHVLARTARRTVAGCGRCGRRGAGTQRARCTTHCFPPARTLRRARGPAGCRQAQHNAGVVRTLAAGVGARRRLGAAQWGPAATQTHRRTFVRIRTPGCARAATAGAAGGRGAAHTTQFGCARPPLPARERAGYARTDIELAHRQSSCSVKSSLLMTTRCAEHSARPLCIGLHASPGEAVR